ncbi:MAG: hypothetical protein KA383_00080 [Phycisphaerae bacterium]|nr:hypothetical protein [Phycisphaerae bacterium]
MPKFVLLLTLWLGMGVAAAQESVIQWMTEPQPAIAEARRSYRPLMVYVLASSKDRDDKLENEQRRALSDPRVLALCQRFVPLKLSRSQHRDILKDFGLPESANMMMSFVTPDGEKLGDLGASGVAQAGSLASKLRLVLQLYGKKLYETDVKPVLQNPDAKPAELKRALQMVAAFEMSAAEPGVLELVARPKLDAATLGLACDALAQFSSEKAVNALLDLARAGNKPAEKALEQCNPAGAAIMVAGLQTEGQPFDYVAYRAAARICGIKNTKPERYFETAKPQLRQQEIERVTKLVQEAAQRWKGTQDDAR